MKMLPGVGVFGTGSSARVLVPLLRAEGFTVEALWGKTEEEAKQLAEEMNITFYTSRTDDVLLHQDVDLVCINIPPPLTRQISVKALGMHCQATEGRLYLSLDNSLSLSALPWSWVFLLGLHLHVIVLWDVPCPSSRTGEGMLEGLPSLKGKD
jgi:hypothetical protein